jgi:predicted transposase YbfD/YdcC
MEKEIKEIEEKLSKIKEEKKQITIDGAKIQKELEEVYSLSKNFERKFNSVIYVYRSRSNWKIKTVNLAN